MRNFEGFAKLISPWDKPTANLKTSVAELTLMGKFFFKQEIKTWTKFSLKGILSISTCPINSSNKYSISCHCSSVQRLGK